MPCKFFEKKNISDFRPRDVSYNSQMIFIFRKMFTLVRFTNDSEGIYLSKHVTIQKENICVVKHGGCKYEARIIETNGKL